MCTSTALHCSAFSICLLQFVHSTALHFSASQHVYCVEQHCPAVHCSTVGSAEILLPSCGSAGRACHTDHSHTDICQHKRHGHLITILFPLNLPLRLGFGLFTLTPFCGCDNVSLHSGFFMSGNSNSTVSLSDSFSFLLCIPRAVRTLTWLSGMLCVLRKTHKCVALDSCCISQD